MIERIILISLLIMISGTVNAQKKSADTLPTTEQFQAMLATCAAGADIQIDGQIKGSISEVYSGAKSTTEARGFKFLTVGEFLQALPSEDRLAGYKLYNICIIKILSGEGFSDIKEIPEVYIIPNNLITYGKPLRIKAKTVIAEDSEIRSFPVGHKVDAGGSGSSGRNGSNGTNGSGGAGSHGANGVLGGNGAYGTNAGEIRIEAEQLIGKLRIINNGANGGTGGNGGSGGNGGKGGNGRSGVSGAFDCKSGPGNGGSGGNAGDGGDSGRGGNGGTGGLVVIDIVNVEPGASLVISSSGGAAGFSGAAGQAGVAGRGGPRGGAPGLCSSGGRGPGSNGVAGQPGRSLGAGNKGFEGQIEVTIAGDVAVTTSTFSKNF